MNACNFGAFFRSPLFLSFPSCRSLENSIRAKNIHLYRFCQKMRAIGGKEEGERGGEIFGRGEGSFRGVRPAALLLVFFSRLLFFHCFRTLSVLEAPEESTRM
jgi:hypothetical protein